MTPHAGHPEGQQLSAYLDGALGPGQLAAVEAHLAACASCRAGLAELRSAKTALSVLGAPEPPAAWLPELRQRLTGERAAALRRSYRTQHALRRRLGVVATATGMLGIALWIAPAPAPPVSFQQEVRQHLVQIDAPMADQISYVVDAGSP
ncbi:MAG TPA: anti-sigma factor [Actinomycetota bacterium]|nr:anti-sigma factor [Actinomycetota bacterium]